jgi:hypothetical protein
MVVAGSPELLEILKNELPTLLHSPSAEKAVSTILLCKDWDGFEPILHECVNRLMDGTIEDFNTLALQRLLATIDFRAYTESTRFNHFTTKVLEMAIKGNRNQWQLICSLLENQTLPREIVDSFFSVAFFALSSEDSAMEVLYGLEYIDSHNSALITHLQSREHPSKLLSKLLLLVESPDDEVAHHAEELERKLRNSLPRELSIEASLQLLQNNFIETSMESLSSVTLPFTVYECVLTVRIELRHWLQWQLVS